MLTWVCRKRSEFPGVVCLDSRRTQSFPAKGDMMQDTCHLIHEEYIFQHVPLVSEFDAVKKKKKHVWPHLALWQEAQIWNSPHWA